MLTRTQIYLHYTNSKKEEEKKREILALLLFSFGSSGVPAELFLHLCFFFFLKPIQLLFWCLSLIPTTSFALLIFLNFHLHFLLFFFSSQAFLMQTPKTPGVSSPVHLSSAVETCPVMQPISPICNEHDEHDECLAREQQQMIMQLLSSGLVQAEDLTALGFTAAEVHTSGFPVTCARSGRCEESESKQAHDTTTTAGRRDTSRPGTRQEKARKRGWQDESAEANAVRTPVAATSRATPPTAVAAKVTAPLSEQLRAEALRSASAAERARRRRWASAGHSCGDDCARGLRCGTAEENGNEDEEASACASAVAGAGATAAAQPTRPVNTALAFSGLDVAVVKEIAQLLQTPADDEAAVEQLRVQAYLDSREDGNTPYM